MSTGYALKVGDFEMIKTFFLYLKSNTNSSSDPKKSIYYFHNDKVVALDKSTYSKIQRFKLQKELAMHPYSLSPNVFKEFLIYSTKNPKHILLRNISFFDRSIEEEEEYLQLNRLILDQKFDKVYTSTNTLIEEFDTDIHDLQFRYDGYDFRITSEGVIEVDAPDEILTKFLKDKRVNKLILGVNC